MKQLKRSGVYKAKNVSFDPKAIIATSYEWWVFVRVIGGQVVFNEYRYSVTTAKHQNKVRTLMRDIGIHIDRTVSFKQSLSRVDSLRELSNLKQAADLNRQAEAERKRLYRNERARMRRAEKRAQQQPTLTPVGAS